MPELSKIFINAYDGTIDTVETGLLELKKNGCTQMEAVRILIDVLNIPLKEADEIVLNSIAWKEEKEAAIRIRNSFEGQLGSNSNNTVEDQ